MATAGPLDPREDAAVSRVVARFGIAPAALESVTPVVSGLGRRAGVRVRTADGEWVLKGHPSGPAVARLEAAHRLERRLADDGFPVAPLCLSDSGTTLVEDDGVHYALHGWVEGRQEGIVGRDQRVAGHPHLVGELAATVGRLHAVSGQQGGGPGDDPDRLLRAPQLSARAIRGPGRRLVSRWHALRLRRRPSQFDRWIIRVLPELAEHADRLAGRSVGDTAGGLIHNDLNWENIVFDERLRVRALLDFDTATPAPWVMEVGAAAVVLVGTEPERVAEFVAAYEEVAGLAVDRDDVRLAMETKCLRSILTSVLGHLDDRAGTSLRAPWCYALYDSLQALSRE